MQLFPLMISLHLQVLSFFHSLEFNLFWNDIVRSCVKFELSLARSKTCSSESFMPFCFEGKLDKDWKDDAFSLSLLQDFTILSAAWRRRDFLLMKEFLKVYLRLFWHGFDFGQSSFYGKFCWKDCCLEIRRLKERTVKMTLFLDWLTTGIVFFVLFLTSWECGQRICWNVLVYGIFFEGINNGDFPFSRFRLKNNLHWFWNLTEYSVETAVRLTITISIHCVLMFVLNISVCLFSSVLIISFFYCLSLILEDAFTSPISEHSMLFPVHYCGFRCLFQALLQLLQFPKTMPVAAFL